MKRIERETLRLYNLYDKDTGALVHRGTKRVAWSVVQNHISSHLGLIGRRADKTNGVFTPPTTVWSKGKKVSIFEQDMLNSIKYNGMIYNIPLSNGETIQLCNATGSQDGAMNKTVTPLGEFGGLTGIALMAKPEDYQILRLVIKTNKNTDFKKVCKDRDLGFIESNNKALGNTILRALDIVLTRLGLELESSHPETLITSLDGYAQRRGKNFQFLTIHDRKVSITGPKDMNVVMGVHDLGDGSGKNLIAITAVVRKAGVATIPAFLAEQGMFPARRGSLEDAIKASAKDGKYLNHRGLGIGKVKLSYSEQLWEENNGQVQDGQAYCSLANAPYFIENMKSALAKVQDPKLKTYLEQGIDSLALAYWLNSNVVIKGWSSGPFGFGKGTIVFRTDLEDNGSIPTLYVDANWLKYIDQTADPVQQLMFHSTVGMDHKPVRTGAIKSLIATAKGLFSGKGKKYATRLSLRDQGVSMSLIDRTLPSRKAYQAMAGQIRQGQIKLKRFIKRYGISAILDKDLMQAEMIAGLEYKTKKELIRSETEIQKALLKKTFAATAKGLYPYITAGWWEGIENGVIYMHPAWKSTIGEDITTAMVARYPALSPAAMKWLEIQYDSRVPLNGMVYHTDQFADMQADVDGDKGPFIPVQGRFMRQLHASRPENYSLPVVKGLNESAGMSLAFPGDARLSKMASIVRGAIAQKAVGLIDNELSSAGIYANEYGVSIDQRIEMSMDSILKLQAVLDSIKKQGQDIPEARYIPLPEPFKLVRSKHLAWGASEFKSLTGSGKRNPFRKLNGTIKELYAMYNSAVKLVEGKSIAHTSRINNATMRFLGLTIRDAGITETRMCKLDGNKYSTHFTSDVLTISRKKVDDLVTEMYLKYTHKAKSDLKDLDQHDEKVLAQIIYDLAAAGGQAFAISKKDVKCMSERDKVDAGKKASKSIIDYMGKLYPEVRQHLAGEYFAFKSDLERRVKEDEK